MNNLSLVRAVADAVLYEGYLLYPYRATSAKNQFRWQFGVLGPQGASEAGLGEDSHLSLQCLLRAASVDGADGDGADGDGADGDGAALTIHIRFLQLQQRRTERFDDQHGFVDALELQAGGQHFYRWDEAIEVELSHTVSLAELAAGQAWNVLAEASEEVEQIRDQQDAVVGRLVRQRWLTRASAFARLEPVNGAFRLTLSIDNQAVAEGMDRDDVLRRSLMGTHVIIDSLDPTVTFVSMIDPPAELADAAAAARQHRCWPVLAGPAGDESVLLGSPIILYDHPEIAEESRGALFDSTEIDEILTLRVMTMTEQEKAEARATDPKAAAIIDRCDQMSVEDLQQLHGILRDPYAPDATVPTVGGVETSPEDGVRSWFDTGDQPWWDPENDERVQPEVDAVMINGVPVSRDSVVRVHPSRRADAQDLFFADQLARVTQVLADVDGGVHVAVVLLDDPAADLHEWYGRYLYFAPDELEPLPAESSVPGAGSKPTERS